jgi:hypothetical protein
LKKESMPGRTAAALSVFAEADVATIAASENAATRAS